MTMKEELIQLKSKLADLKDRIEADDQEAISEGVKLSEEIKAKEAAVKTAEEKAALLNQIGKKEKEDNSMPEKKMARSLGENFVMNMQEGLKAGQRRSAAGVAEAGIGAKRKQALDGGEVADEEGRRGKRREVGEDDLHAGEHLLGYLLDVGHGDSRASCWAGL